MPAGLPPEGLGLSRHEFGSGGLNGPFEALVTGGSRLGQAGAFDGVWRATGGRGRLAMNCLGENRRQANPICKVMWPNGLQLFGDVTDRGQASPAARFPGGARGLGAGGEAPSITPPGLRFL